MEAGQESSASHVEHMAIDQSQLWRHAFPSLTSEVPAFSEFGFIGRLREGGRRLYVELGVSAYSLPAGEPDTVLAWRAFALGSAGLPLAESVRAIKPFAEHPHFAVREWAWLALRPAVVADPHDAIGILTGTLDGASSYWRRFACEVTRPRSVWGAHIPKLKRTPELGEPLLVGIACDESAYVVTALTNWLNDVCRTHRGWVEKFCAQHGGDRASKLSRRATRSCRTS